MVGNGAVYLHPTTFFMTTRFSGWIAEGVSDIPVLGGNTSIEFKSDRFEINRSHNINLGYEHQLSEHSILGGGLLYNHSRPKQRIQNRGLYEFQVNPFLEAQIELNGAGRWSNINPSLFFESANEKHSYQIGADFIGYRSKTPNQVRSDYFDRRASLSTQRMKFITVETEVLMKQIFTLAY